MQDNAATIIILVLFKYFQRTQEIFTRLWPLALLLCHYSKLPIGAGLGVAIIVLDLDLQGLLVVLLGLYPFVLLLGYPAQLSIDISTAFFDDIGIEALITKPDSQCFLVRFFCCCRILKCKLPLRNVVNDS